MNLEKARVEFDKESMRARIFPEAKKRKVELI
jgi:hypothetical protein